MDYRTTLAWLSEVETLGIKLGLQNMRILLASLGEPQLAYPAAVIAGTNGKGSVTAMLASVLRCAGRRVGRYTSPHLVDYTERIAVDGSDIGREDLAGAVSRVREHIDGLLSTGGLSSHPTHFEALTAAAFCHFRDRGVEAAVLEVGMGGRLDAVATARTSVAVITNVTREHARYLGETPGAIAAEKAAIIREGCAVVTGESRSDVLDVIRAEGRGRGVRLIERHRDAVVDHAPGAAAGRFSLTTRRARYGDLIVPLAGRHQVENAAVAVLAAEALCASEGWELSTGAVTEGLARTSWPGRLQIVGERPLMLLDGAHNPAACVALARALKDLRDTGAFERICLIFGVLEDKELEPMLSALLALEPRLVITRGASERFRDPGEVAVTARALGCQPMLAPDVGSAIDMARSWAGAGDAICLCGSLYLVGEALAATGGRRIT